ncbi:unnamed protein product [Clonostachys chloroleuca]|uniref:HpcH/HpaI aldolase/citrate lyase domain-containing protein n=1 Tax=Clonostachys chloroleuca TaxID=1926264 RepID=A0AA35Q3X4_9HYPO|nr:unnamed protein product [Clonostachys chloroleuca]
MSFETPLTTKVVNPRLRLLNALRKGLKPVMTFLGLPSIRTAQVVAQTGLDGIITDCEHGHISDDSMHVAVTTIASRGVSPLVRISMTHADLIKRALDAGAHGIVVPMINTPEEARAVVANAKFPPQGFRGQGSACPAIALGIDTPEQGVENVDAISAVEGVDEPEFVEVIDKIVAAARKHGKWALLTKQHLQTFDTVSLSYDVRAMQNWYKSELEVAKEA